MNAHPLDRPWLHAWCDELNTDLRSFLNSFERIYGYPPDDNKITTVAGGDSASTRQLSTHPAVSPALSDFYTVIENVTLPDIGNGYFVHPARHVLDDLTHDGPVRVGQSGAVIFGSDGGGILFAISPDGTIHRSHTASRDSDFKVIATDLHDFLDQLRQAATRFIQTRQPGSL
jgi:hypothetical protein